MTLIEMMKLAEKHSLANGSAFVCYKDAKAAVINEDYDAAFMWCTKTVKHAVGIFHPDYKALAK